LKKFSLFYVVLQCCFLSTTANHELIDSIQNDRSKSFFLKAGIGYASGMTLLGTSWYRDQGLGTFRLFNDLPEWKQMDKAGHLFTAYHLTRGLRNGCSTSGGSTKDCNLKSALFAFTALSSIEILDGFSPAYGASVTDLAANAAGTLLFVAQDLSWGEQRIVPKFSFHNDQLAEKRPEVLGASTLERLLKNYNGQTYWLSADLDNVSELPGWLNLSLGYGANEMVFGREQKNMAAGFNAQRRIFIGLDIDLKDIPVKKRWVKKLFMALNMIRIPAPAIEFNYNGIRLHPLYF